MWFDGPMWTKCGLVDLNSNGFSPFKISCGLVVPKTWCILMDPLSNVKQWTLFLPQNHSNLMWYNWPSGSSIPHEVFNGEKFHISPSNHTRFSGPLNHLRCQKMAKNDLGPSNHMSAGNIAFNIVQGDESTVKSFLCIYFQVFCGISIKIGFAFVYLLCNCKIVCPYLNSWG